MNLNENEVRTIELEKREYEESVKMLEAFDRLRQNEDFVKLIEEGYLDQNMKRLVYLLGEQGFGDEQRQNTKREIEGIACFTSWLRNIHNSGLQAKKVLEEYEAELAREE